MFTVNKKENRTESPYPWKMSENYRLSDVCRAFREAVLLSFLLILNISHFFLLFLLLTFNMLMFAVKSLLQPLLKVSPLKVVEAGVHRYS